MNRPQHLIIIVVTVLCLSLATTRTAGAHAVVVRSEPGDSALLTEPPTEITIWFDEAISAQFSSVRLFNTVSSPVAGLGVHALPGDPTALIITLPVVPDGVYSLLWKTLSATDGHNSQGILVFGVGEGANPSGAVPVAVENRPAWSEALFRWLNLGALMFLIGGVAVMELIIPPATQADSAVSMRRRLCTAMRGAIAVALLAAVGLLSRQIAAVNQEQAAGMGWPLAAYTMLSTTTWGIFWLVRSAALLLLALTLRLIGRDGQRFLHRGRRRPALFGAVGIVITAQTLSSHAAGAGDQAALATLVDGIHLLAAGLWLGALAALFLATWDALRVGPTNVAPLIRTTWRRFSLLAAGSVGVLMVTGLYSAGREVASMDALLTTVYGQIFMLKLLAVVGALVLGALNAAILSPRAATVAARLLRRPTGWTPVPRSRLRPMVLAELSAGLAIVGLTAVMTSAAPPRGPEFADTIERQPAARSLQVDDMTITLQTKPNRAGPNVFNIFAATRLRPEPAEIMRVIVRFTYLDDDLGLIQADADEVEHGRYLLNGNYLSLPGRWQINVVVRRRGLPDSGATFDWQVAPPGATQPVLISRRLLRPWTTGLAAAWALAALFLMLGLAVWRVYTV